jgi:hypothetical protein
MVCRSVWFCKKCGRENPWQKAICDGCRSNFTGEPRRWVCCSCRTDNPWEKTKCEACQHAREGAMV